MVVLSYKKSFIIFILFIPQHVISMSESPVFTVSSPLPNYPAGIIELLSAQEQEEYDDTFNALELSNCSDEDDGEDDGTLYDKTINSILRQVRDSHNQSPNTIKTQMKQFTKTLKEYPDPTDLIDCIKSYIVFTQELPDRDRTKSSRLLAFESCLTHLLAD